MMTKDKQNTAPRTAALQKILIIGYGKMGHVLEDAIADTPDTTVAAIVGKTPDADVYAELSAIDTPFDCLVDFSHHSNINKVLRYAQEKNKPLVMAVTGFNETQRQQIADAATCIPIVFAQNMSAGVNILKGVIAHLSRALGDGFDIELIEKHHNQKEDSPSGTAKMLLAAIHQIEDKTLVYGREGYKKRAKNEIGVHSVRGGTIAGEHTILFAGHDEIIEIKHTALSKRIFADGAIRAARFAVTHGAGLYGMDDILKTK
ncbi:MAG: 4-hydroxy-tetrahydrodipicolinate reductase [Prevotellaceae bacterium]|jgi:4-hydroxy-tetrahydrodipicolinate reductase|nr:4-hydroxy-tetrahydrodipicolinate reductase [Prevotellaceae bacterium]